MILTGFTDEFSPDFRKQLEACRFLDWDHIDLRTVGEKNICHLGTHEMEEILEQLSASDIRIASFGSPIANWSRPLSHPLEEEIRELEHAASLMRMAGVRGIRVMSYKTDALLSPGDPFGEEVVKRLKELSIAAENQGIVLLHENCETWGGQSPDHTLFLLDRVDSPAFRLIFDTGNPPGTPDVRGKEPYGRQKGLDFIRAVYEAVDMVHIKDARYVPENPADEIEYTWPGEGEGQLQEVFSFLKKKGYEGPFSIEPHMAVVYHDESVQSDEQVRRDTFYEYARRSRILLEEAGF